ncbi:DUF2075 domain-containing protein [Vagococcus humatus]|uniref:Schlafen group 3-like DNA/RNA helicase domain-containing protein n=1 Tax=Vagococcus humatus TaxID=1889241 RepID=A0A429Z6P5_9ENTE|nr:DUF2075 domain-containing protein [Vagococcus humatus]RST89370.1 hypothetical protein C7P63_06245 [Vagococcus humatus]
MEELSQSTFVLPENKALSNEQQQLKEKIFNFITCHKQHAKPAVFVIEGDAGSGKSVVLNHVFTELQQLSRQPDSQFYQLDNKLVVNHNEMLKIYKEVAGVTPYLLKKDYQKPTPFINHYQKLGKKADVVFVDEAHLLLTKPDAYNRFEQQNQLTELLKLAHVIVLVFDTKQVIKLKSYWDTSLLSQVLKEADTERFHLDTQYRIEEPAVAEWINQFVAGHILPVPDTEKFDLRFFEDGQPMYELIRQKDHEVKLSRMIATADYPFTVFGDKIWYVQAGSLRLPWDKINFTDRPWAQRPETLDEVGSIYTIQGFDLNYAGVILGPSIKYDPQTEKVYVDIDQYQDSEAFKKRSDLEKLDQAKAEIIMNSVNILLKRGKYGLYIYAEDPLLRGKLLELTH